MPAFISYSRANSDFAVRLAKNLKSAGYNVWLDQLDIPTGARWDDEIEMALEACTTFIVILSPDSIRSQNVKDEVGYAIDAGKDILPLRIQSGDIPFRLRRFQYVDFTNKPYEASLKEIKSLLAPAGHLRTSQDAEKRLSEAEEGPITEKGQAVRAATLPQPTIPRAKTPRSVGAPGSKRPISSGLVIGAVAVAALVIAGIVFSATRASKPPAATPSSAAPVVENLPTEQPTATAETTQVPTQAAQPETLLVNLLEGKGLDNNWEYLTKGKGKVNEIEISPSNEGLIFHLNDKDLHAYYMYTPVSYENVIIRVKAENIGQNSFSVSLVCRRTGDTWYEFSISAGSLWWLYDFHGEYERIDNAGTTFGNPGKSVNEYEMRCIGDEISLYVNGQSVDKPYKIIPPRDLYTEGQAGFGVSTERGVFPIDVRVMELEVSRP